MDKERMISALDYDRLIHERVSGLLERKAEENKVAVGRLAAVEKSWTKLNAGILEESAEEFDLAEAEVRAMTKAKGRLAKNPCEPESEKDYAIAGKILDTSEGVGLSRLFVRVLDPDEEQPLILETETDAFGNFTFNFSGEVLKKLEGNNRELSFRAYSDPGDPKSLVHSEDVRMNIRPGRVKDLSFKIRCDDELMDRVEAGVALKDNVESDDEIVRLRFEDLKAADDVFNRRADVYLEEIKTLREELSVETPDLPPSFSLPSDDRLELLTPSEGEVAETRVVPKGTDLEEIDGIGPSRAKRLREAGVRDAETFMKRDEESLRMVLGDVDISVMKKDAEALVKRNTVARRSPK